MSVAIATYTESKTRYTPEDLLAMPDGENYELVDGRLVERNMGGIELDRRTIALAA